MRNKFLELRKVGIYKKENKHLKTLYLTVVNKDHQPRSLGIQMFELEVLFVNNFVMKIQFPYFHKNPDIAVSYLQGQKLNLIK